MGTDRVRLLEITEVLKKQYKDNKAVSLTQIKEEHPEISFAYVNGWTNKYFGQTLKTYLVEQGIIEASKIKTEEEKIDEAKQNLRDVMIALSEKYHDKKAKTLSQIMGENTDLPISNINIWTKLLFDTSAKKYLEQQVPKQGKSRGNERV